PPVVFRRGFVERISMDGSTVVERGEEIFALAPIRELLFQECEGFESLAKCKHLLRLHTLNLTGVVLSSDGSDAPALLRSKYLANLTTLFVRRREDNGALDAGGLRAIAGTKHLAKLERLDISDNWMFIDDNPIREVTACRKALVLLGEKMPALRELGLGSMGLRDRDVIALVKQKWMNRLRALDLSENTLSEKACQALCKSKHLANLERLDLTDNQYLDEHTDDYGLLPRAVQQMLKKRFGKGVTL
ncbi:MAG: hypothetical protein L0241_05885, partial [Planctomycetia bacterium]|nr:hypothetical protein [Planctomycetia bacterium]